MKRYKREYQQPIRLKVINVIKHWIYGYYSDDFANDAELQQQLRDFVDKVGVSYQRFQQVLANILQKKMRQQLKVDSQSLLDYSLLSKMETISINSDASLESSKFISQTNISRSSSTSNADDSSVSSAQLSSKYVATSSLNDTCDSSEIFGDEMPEMETHLELQYPYDILTVHPLEFARQATMMEFELYKAIKPSELISLGWNKPDQRYKLSPNLTKLINQSNKFTYWYAKCIVDTLNLDERVAVVQRILEIAKHFYDMNNFMGVKEIYAAFEASSVERLKVTRKLAGVEQHEMYAVFKQLFESHDRGYLDRLKKCDPPCLPFIGSHLTIINKNQEYNKLNYDNHNMKIIMQQQEELKTVDVLNNDNNNNSIESLLDSSDQVH